MKKLTLIVISLLLAFCFQNTLYASQQQNLPNDSNEVAKAIALNQQVIEEDRVIKSVDQAIAVTLPQAIEKKIGNTRNLIVIDAMTFTPKGAKLTAYMTSEVPRSEKKLALRGKDINFCAGGFTGGARLELISDVDVPLGQSMKMIIKGGKETNNTFVECDCKGYKSMGLQGEIEFNREKFIPEGANGKIIQDPKTKVKASFQTELVGWDDLLVEIGISPFQIKGMKDFSFSVNSAVFDFSDSTNSPSMSFPKGYEFSDSTIKDKKMWKGFFLKDLVVKLPGNLSEDSSQRSSIEAHNMLIDKMGLSGKFEANNVLPISKGNANGWAFSVDKIYAEFMKNELSSCGFNGLINVPPLGDTTTLFYKAFIDPGNQYSFIVENKDTIKMDIWKADLTLDPNSYIDISVIDGKFKPKAVFNGELSLKPKDTEIAGIAFEQLVITPEAPFIKAKAFSFGKPNTNQKLGKYPISISNMGLVNDTSRTGLKFDLKLNLVDEKSGGFTGETGLTLFAKSFKEKKRQRWRYDSLEISRILIDIDGGAYKLTGKAEWFKKDTLYGNGFAGSIDAQFKALPKISASALFGNVNGMRYWYADAMISLNKGLPLFGGINLYGFGGGAYHHMRQIAWNEKLMTNIGKTPSGIIYKPDDSTKLGLKATVNLGLDSKSLFNSDLTFEMAFNNYNGVDRILFKGNGYFMTPIEKSGSGISLLQEKCKAISNGQEPNVLATKDNDPGRSSIYAFVNLDFDFRNDLMHGNLGTYINVGDGVLRGTGPGGKAGEAVMHFAKDEWYIYIGTPTNRIGIKALRFAELNSYFMVGTKIPASPPPPEKVSEILGDIDLDYMSSLNNLGEGKGIAFGAGLQFNTGHKKFFPFYADFNAGAGFDVMLKNYGNVSCLGRSEPLGINGWYANGQVWAYIEGAIGIEVDLRFVKGEFEILKVGAAAVLQAKLPNPFWMRGVIGGRYSILGGLVKGRCRFDFTVGEECEIIGGGSPVEAIQVISELTPNEGSTDINVFNVPQAIFAMPIGKVFELQDLNGNNIAFKIELEHFKLYNEKQNIIGDLEWNAEKDVLAFNPFEIMPPGKKLDLDVEVSFKEKKNGTWQTVTDNGTKVIERMHTSFTTGKAPDYIPLSNVLYSYPMTMMFNYYQDETNIGYIQLKQGQTYLFNPGTEWKQIARFADIQGNKLDFDFTYTESEKRVNFKRTGKLVNNNLYTFQLVNVPAQANGPIDKNIVADVKTQNVVEGNESTIEINTKKAEGNLDILEEKNIFETNFRTSIYNRFSEKINTMKLTSYLKYYIYPSVHDLYIYNDGNEMFSDIEVFGNENINALVQFSANLDNKWYNNVINPLVYENYPFEGITISWRDNNILGTPPAKAVEVFQYPQAPRLTEDQLKTGINNPKPLWVGYCYRLPYYMNKDYYDLLNKSSNKYFMSPSVPERIKYLFENNFKSIHKGDYKVSIQYVLPGSASALSSEDIKFVSPVGAE